LFLLFLLLYSMYYLIYVGGVRWSIFLVFI
jgi:hypothetical protein